jgi:hypothetical protein
MMHGAAIRQPNGRTWRVDESISRQFLKSKLSQLRVAGDKHQFFELRHCIFGFVLPPPFLQGDHNDSIYKKNQDN